MENSQNSDCGARIKRLRKEASMTQTELAEKIGVKRSSIANWESGRRFPECEILMKMSYVFKTPIDYFYGLSNHRYNIQIPDYIEIDLSKLNSVGVSMLCEYYNFLAANPKYSQKG